VKATIMPFFLIAVIAIAALVLILLFLWASFVSASPGEVKVISGPRGQRVLHGKTGWKIPLLERVDTMTASMISVDAQTTDFVPTNDYINVRVDAAVKVRIATDDDTLFKAATRNFLYKTTSEISEEVRDTLEGHLRAIIGQMKLTDIITDRAAFSERVQENAKQDLEEMGLLIVAFNIQNVTDQNGVIDNLGIDNTEQIRKTAAIAKAVEIAKKNFFHVPMIRRTIPHLVQGEDSAGVVLLRPASPGTGVIAGGPVRAVLDCAGVHDILSKSLGSSNAINIVHATVDALKQLEQPEAVAARRGLPLERVAPASMLRARAEGEAEKRAAAEAAEADKAAAGEAK